MGEGCLLSATSMRSDTPRRCSFAHACVFCDPKQRSSSFSSSSMPGFRSSSEAFLTARAAHIAPASASEAFYTNARKLPPRPEARGYALAMRTPGSSTWLLENVGLF